MAQQQTYSTFRRGFRNYESPCIVVADTDN